MPNSMIKPLASKKTNQSDKLCIKTQLRPAEAKESYVLGLSILGPNTENPQWRESNSQAMRFWAKGSPVRDVSNPPNSPIIQVFLTKRWSYAGRFEWGKGWDRQDAQITHFPPQTKRPPCGSLQPSPLSWSTLRSDWVYVFSGQSSYSFHMTAALPVQLMLQSPGYQTQISWTKHSRLSQGPLSGLSRMRIRGSECR